MVTYYNLSLLLLDHNINKGTWLPTPFGCAHAPFGVGKVIFSLGKEFSQPPPNLQGIIQLQGPVALTKSFEKCRQDQS